MLQHTCNACSHMLLTGMMSCMLPAEEMTVQNSGTRPYCNCMGHSYRPQLQA